MQAISCFLNREVPDLISASTDAAVSANTSVDDSIGTSVVVTDVFSIVSSIGVPNVASFFVSNAS
ncbi:hypothetical protein D3C77_575170 [compost metagenome]